MDGLLSAIAKNGYPILFVIVFMEAIGLPVPAALALLLAGAACAAGAYSPVITLSTALSAMLLGDLLMYFLGRYTGWWLLGLLCRVSLNPEACILRSADAFYKRGRWVLVFAKFLPGINTMAPPLAGSMNMRFAQFLPLDLAGASLYTAAFWGTGFLFSNLLGTLTRAYSTLGSILIAVFALIFLGYLLYRATLWFQARKLTPVASVSVEEVARRRASVMVIDVRSHGYYDKSAMRIEGSSRLEPNALSQTGVELPADKEVVLYCTCIRDATSIRVARLLAERGIRARVMSGGLREWKKAGLPLEPVPSGEVIELPTFS